MTVMGFGFVVARFGLFLRLLSVQASGVPATVRPDHFSNAVGIGLVLVGVGCMCIGAVQHRSYVATIPPQDVPRTHRAIYPVGLSLVLAALGLALAAYLAL